MKVKVFCSIFERKIFSPDFYFPCTVAMPSSADDDACANVFSRCSASPGFLVSCQSQMKPGWWSTHVLVILKPNWMSEIFQSWNLSDADSPRSHACGRDVILSTASHLSGWQCDYEDERRKTTKHLILSGGSARGQREEKSKGGRENSVKKVRKRKTDLRGYYC